MAEDTFSLLKKLSEAMAPVGREMAVQDIIEEHLRPRCDETRRDKIGNLIGTSQGGNGRHYAIVAHADEVGFLVSGIEDTGFIRVKWNTQSYVPDLRLIPGQWVMVMAEKGYVPGVFAVKTAHIAGEKAKKRIPTYEEVFLDIGAQSREEIAEQGINIGDSVVYAAPLEKLGHYVSGKSMDDRVGLTVMLRVAELCSKIPEASRPTMTYISTVMEEMGAKGAAAIARGLDVDAVFVIDIGLADDHPGTKGEARVGLGKGPTLVVKDSSIHYSHDLIRALVETAEAEKIPIQRAVYHNYATDGVQFASEGQRTAVVAIPCRYSHSSFETLSMKDVEMTIELLMKHISRSG
jgi:putative aminopeptidase FrvX